MFRICSIALVVIFAAFASVETAVAAPGGQGKGRGNAYGYGHYKNNGGGGSGGAPLPALGATVLGQAIAIGGLGLLGWRTRNRRRNAERQSSQDSCSTKT